MSLVPTVMNKVRIKKTERKGFMRNRKQKCMMACAAILAAITVMSALPAGSPVVEEQGTQTVTEVSMDYAAQENVLPVTLLEMTGADAQLQSSAQLTTPQGNLYRSELTNEWIDISLKNQRPVAIMVDNEKTALPHYGLTEADVVYEMMNSTANNRITRFMAIVKDWGKITRFGNIRSTRPTNVLLAAEWNAILVHDGGPYYINEWLAKGYSNHLSGGFARVNNGKKREYTEYVTTGELDKRIKAAGYSKEYNAYYAGPHFTFSETENDLSTHAAARPCNAISLPFPHNQSMLMYNPATKTYDYYEYGQAHKDPQHNNAQLSFKNLLIQDTTFSQLDKGGYMIYNAMDYARSGYYITDGRAIEVLWSKLSETGPTIYLDKLTGLPIQLNTGKTYIALVPSDSWSSVVIQ